jgi:hypothetical protein
MAGLLLQGPANRGRGGFGPQGLPGLAQRHGRGGGASGPGWNAEAVDGRLGAAEEVGRPTPVRGGVRGGQRQLPQNRAPPSAIPNDAQYVTFHGQRETSGAGLDGSPAREVLPSPDSCVRKEDSMPAGVGTEWAGASDLTISDLHGGVSTFGIELGVADMDSSAKSGVPSKVTDTSMLGKGSGPLDACAGDKEGMGSSDHQLQRAHHDPRPVGQTSQAEQEVRDLARKAAPGKTKNEDEAFVAKESSPQSIQLTYASAVSSDLASSQSPESIQHLQQKSPCKPAGFRHCTRVVFLALQEPSFLVHTQVRARSKRMLRLAQRARTTKAVKKRARKARTAKPSIINSRSVKSPVRIREIVAIARRRTSQHGGVYARGS